MIRLRYDQLAELPPALAETLPNLPGLGDRRDVGRGVQRQHVPAAGYDGGGADGDLERSAVARGRCSSAWKTLLFRGTRKFRLGSQRMRGWKGASG